MLPTCILTLWLHVLFLILCLLQTLPPLFPGLVALLVWDVSAVIVIVFGAVSLLLTGIFLMHPWRLLPIALVWDSALGCGAGFGGVVFVGGWGKVHLVLLVCCSYAVVTIFVNCSLRHCNACFSISLSWTNVLVSGAFVTFLAAVVMLLLKYKCWMCLLTKFWSTGNVCWMYGHRNLPLLVAPMMSLFLVCFAS